MNRVLYIHDHKFIQLKGKYYSEGKFTNCVFSRYNVFNSNVRVVSRVINTEQENNLNEISKSNISFIPVKGISFFLVFTKFFFFNLNLIRKEIKRSEGIIVRLPSFLGIFTLIINLFYRKSFFIEFVGDPEEALTTSKNRISLLFKFFIYLFSVLNKFFVKKADGVIYVTEFALQYRYPTLALQSYASNVELRVEDIPLDLKTYRNRKSYFKIGMIGSFNNSYKGIDDAIQAIYLLRKKGNLVYLHILGSGKMKSEYLAMAQEMDLVDNIIFDGVLAGGAEVNQWLDSLDLYIQPSRTEGLPRSLIEAMARGLPAVATNVGGIPELLPSEFLIQPNASQELANKIELLISSQQLRYEQGVTNYNKAKEYDAAVLKERRAKFWQQARDIVQEELK